MKKKNLLVMSLALLCGAALTACGGDSSKPYPDEPEESYVEDTRRFNIYFDEELTTQIASGNIELEVGKRFLLWQHISVPGGTYTLEALTDNIEIDGHVIVAKAYGPFKVKIAAAEDGTTKTVNKSISGNVVSSGKIAFNNLWNAASENGNYTATNEYFGTVLHNENYIEMEMSSDNSGNRIFTGNVYDEKSGHYYTYDYSENAPQNLEWGSGYGASMEMLMTTKGFGIPSSSWVEQFDESGNSLNKFVLEDTFDTHGFSSLIDPFMDKLFSIGNGYSVLVSRASATKLVATLDEASNSLILTAARDNGSLIKTYVSGTTTYNVVTTISDIGFTAHDEVDAWLANPVYPEQVDVSKLKQFFLDIEKAQNYTCVRQGSWFDLTSGQFIEAPQKAVDSGFADYLNAYTAVDFVADEALVNVVIANTPGIYNYIGQGGIVEGWTVPEVGSVRTYFANEYGLSGAAGTMDEETGVVTYDAAQSLNSSVTSIWGHAKSETGWSVPLVHEGLADIIDLMSFSRHSVDAGLDLYYFGTTGDDCNPNAEDNRVLFYWGDEKAPESIFGGFESFVSYLSADGLDTNTNVMANILFGRTGMEYYYSRFFVLEKGHLEMDSILLYDSKTAYVTTISWQDVGTTELDSGTLSLIGKAA